MPLSSKLKADYVELINGELDRIPIKDDKEFDLVVQELQKIINPPGIFMSIVSFFNSPALTSILSKEIQAQIDYVRYLLKTPKDFVALQSDYAEYQQILTNRIKAKISELNSFNSIEKQTYIKFQKEIHQSSELKQN